ncbi:MAG: transglutaminase-like domain-containing protein [archaeon]
MNRAHILLLFGFVLIFGCISQPSTPPSQLNTTYASNNATSHVAQTADQLFASAKLQYDNDNYTSASKLYAQAREAYTKQGNPGMEREAYYEMLRAMRTTYEFEYDEKTAMEMALNSTPKLPEELIQQVLDDKRNYIINESRRYYFTAFIDNIYYRNLDLMRQKTKGGELDEFFGNMMPIILNKTEFNGSYMNPIRYELNEELNLPRADLPATGTLKIWIPLPTETESQKDIKIISIGPQEYMKGLPVTTGDIGFVYFEIPLNALKTDLNFTVNAEFTSYEQRFRVDPEKVGRYDTESEEYKKYTTSYGNTVITPEIKELALKIKGNETNPYLIAEKIYWYVITNVPYSYMPHLMLEQKGIPEAQYVDEYQVGDCGSQSMYFTALCRAVGIPARTIGGYQMFPPQIGTHFWAQFYLPNYGWIPVDTTVAELADRSDELTEDETKGYKEFFFGNLDAYRYVIQKDADVQPTPQPDESNMYSMVMQHPAFSCDTATEDLGAVIEDNRHIAIVPINENN